MHIPVLSNQVLHFLQPSNGDVIIDCTLGTGGHAEQILQMIGSSGHLYGIDIDDRNLKIAKENLKEHKNVTYIHDNFENLEEIGERAKKEHGSVDGILMDLGLSSLHFDEAERGFSHRFDGPLDMRLDKRQDLTAADIVNTYSVKDLQELFSTNAQERYAHRIAKKIAEDRKENLFTTTTQLKECIESIVPGVKGRRGTHPSVTRVFQALRIVTNREIEVLGHALVAALKVLNQGGTIVVISFHSGEDRVVKNVFRDAKKEGIVEVLTKRPIEPEEEDIEINIRARSAKLRAAKKL